MADQKADYPSIHPLDITANEPNTDDPLSIRHLKKLQARKLKSQSWYSTGDNKGSNKSHRTASDTSMTLSGATSSTSTFGEGSDISSAIFMTRCTSRFFYRDETLILIIFFSIMSGIGMIWSTQSVLINELMDNISVGLKTFGSLLTTLRLGKIFGHLFFVPVSNIFSGRNIEISIILQIMMSVSTFLVPHCQSWLALGINWFVMGILYGMLDSSVVIINQIVSGNGPNNNRTKYTNSCYAFYSIGTFVALYIVKGVRTQTDEKGVLFQTKETDRETLTGSFYIVAGFQALMVLAIVTISIFRYTKGIKLPDQNEQYIMHQSGFKYAALSIILVSASAMLFVCLQCSFWVYLVIFAENSFAKPTNAQVLSLFKMFYGAALGVRILNAVLSFFCRKNLSSQLLVISNIFLGTACCLILVLRDSTYNGLIVIVIAYGLGMGLFHNSLLNFLTDHIVMTPKSSFPFFIASTTGMIITPAIVPHIITSPDGSISVNNFIHLIASLTFLCVLTSSCLMFLQTLKDDNAVKVIQIMPDVMPESRRSMECTQVKSAMSGSVVTSPYPSGSARPNFRSRQSTRLSTMSTKISLMTAKIDPALSFVSSIG